MKKRAKKNVSFDRNLDFGAILEKKRKDRSKEEQQFYTWEKSTYLKGYFFFFLRELNRIRWIDRKNLLKRFAETILFIFTVTLIIYSVSQFFLWFLHLIYII